MKIPEIKRLVETYTLEQLQAAEAEIAEGNVPAIEVHGDDEGEKLTHLFGAQFIREKVESGVEFTVALREFTQKVRNSIN